VTAGRKDVEDFFKLSDVFTMEHLSLTPLLIFTQLWTTPDKMG
jgi:hypothetical protein